VRTREDEEDIKMKSFAIAVALGFVLVSLSFASPIQCSTITNYAGLVATGSAGCEIGDKLFSDFFIDGDLTGSQVSIAQVINEPPEETGFTFGFNLSVLFGNTADFRIGYLIQTVDQRPIIDSAELDMNGKVVNGEASVDEQVCAGDIDINCFHGTIYELSTSLGLGSTVLQDGVTFNKPVSEVYVSKDINVISAGNGYATISLVTETVDQLGGQVPEPATMGLGVLGILLGLGIKRFSRA
jgi:hypothetical protein